MLKYLMPNKIISLNNKTINLLITLLIAVTIFGLIFALIISPPDYIQGDTVRIMYVHVPASILSLISFAFIGIFSIFNLIFKIKFFPLIAKSLAPIGFVFAIISIITGSLWGKPTWGTWWAWDARLTSMIILLLFYIAYILTWKFIDNFEKANKISSIIAIIGLLNLPIVKYSVDWWNTLHQPSSISLTSAPSIHYSMLVPLAIMFFGMVIYLLIIFLVRYKTELIKLKFINDESTSDLL